MAHNALLGSLGGRWALALAVAAELETSGLDARSYQAVVSACDLGGRWRAALAAFAAAEAEGAADLAVANCAVRAARWPLSVHLLAAAETYGGPDEVSERIHLRVAAVACEVFQPHEAHVEHHHESESDPRDGEAICQRDGIDCLAEADTEVVEIGKALLRMEEEIE